MMYFIMLPCYLIVLGISWFSLNYVSKPNGFLLLGVKIPKEEMGRKEISEIVSRYKRKEKRLILGMILTMIAGFFLRSYTIISSIYCFLWVFVWLGFMQIFLNRTYDEMYAYKKSQGWVVGESFTISVDTEVARLKKQFPYPVWHWIMIGVFTVVGCFLWMPHEKDGLMGYVIIGVNVTLFLVLFGLYFLTQRVKTTIYSNHSEVNVALNGCYCYELTKAMVWSGYVNALSWLAGGFVPELEYHYEVILIVTFLSSVIICGLIFVAFARIQKERKVCGVKDGEMERTVDDDIYWRGGQYSNPNDPKLWVEKRMGIGMQMNNARPVAKVINVATTILIVGMFVWLFYEIPLDFPTLSLKLNQNVIKIEATRYKDQIALEDVSKAKLLDDLPRMYKNNGFADGTYDFGQFRVTDYGQCKVYISRKQPQYLVLSVGEKIYIINSEQEEELQNIMKELSQRGLLNATE